MKKPPLLNSLNLRVSVVAAAPAEDHASLTDIFLGSAWSLCPGTEWELSGCASLRSALNVLRNGRVPIVLCDCDLGESAWIAMLEQVRSLPAPPFLVVTSRLADDHLWAEALNLGAYDVLAKPFDPKEVVRCLSFAWLHWQNQWGPTALTTRAARAAAS